MICINMKSNHNNFDWAWKQEIERMDYDLKLITCGVNTDLLKIKASARGWAAKNRAWVEKNFTFLLHLFVL